MKKIVEEVTAQAILISDGAWGTMLLERGLEPGECPEEWCISHPDDVYAIAQGYVEAGAQIIETNSFGANRFKLAHFGFEQRVSEFNECAAALSRKAAGSDRHVIGSVGPTGKILITGDVVEQQLYEVFTEQIMALQKGCVDAVCIETMSALDEACIAIRAAKEQTALEIICTFTFEKTISGDYRTMMGVSPSKMAETVVRAGADIIGANCGNGSEEMIDIVKEIRAACPAIPILVHTNAGTPSFVNDAVVYPEKPDIMAQYVPLLIEAGANIIGGCCGTTPEHIRAIARAVSKMK